LRTTARRAYEFEHGQKFRTPTAASNKHETQASNRIAIIHQWEQLASLHRHADKQSINRSVATTYRQFVAQRTDICLKLF